MSKCPKCHTENHKRDAEFCTNCGLKLELNHCSDPSCKANEKNWKLEELDCFCQVCGAKSTYYEQGFIQPDEGLIF